MHSSRSAEYAPRVFKAGELRAVFKTLLASAFPAEYAADVSIFRRLPDGTEQSLHRRGLDELSEICDLRSQGSFVVEIGKPLGSLGVSGEVRLFVSADPEGYIGVSYNASTVEQLAQVSELLEAKLQLTAAPSAYERGRQEAEERKAASPIWREIKALDERIGRLERSAGSGEQLTCFLSFQFSEPSLTYANSVRHFLTLLGIRVVTGQGYEPRQIQEKVKHRLHANVDVVVLIEAGGRPSAWTRDEIALAQTPGVFFVPLVEEGSQFDRGMFGDHEYIPFPVGHVSEAFIGLLQGITYVRSARASIVEGSS